MGAGVARVGFGFVNVRSKIDDSLEPIAKVPPFRYYQGGLAIDTLHWESAGVMIGIGFCFILIAWHWFEGRDIRLAAGADGDFLVNPAGNPPRPRMNRGIASFPGRSGWAVDVQRREHDDR
jgi:hypothetical protein